MWCGFNLKSLFRNFFFPPRELLCGWFWFGFFFNKGNVIDMIFRDFSTKFDVLPHRKLLVQMETMGISTKPIRR